MEKTQSKCLQENITHHQEQQKEDWKIIILNVESWIKMKYKNS